MKFLSGLPGDNHKALVTVQHCGANCGRRQQSLSNDVSKLPILLLNSIRTKDSKKTVIGIKNKNSCDLAILLLNIYPKRHKQELHA